MRELSIEDVEQVSGGDAIEALGFWGLAISIASVTGIATLGVATAVIASPFAAIAALGLSFAGGVSLLTPSNGKFGTVTVGGDYKESDC